MGKPTPPPAGRKGEIMKKLKHIGEGYHGFDAGRDAFVFVKKGDVVEVSDGKADQLFADFKAEWVEVAEQKAVVEEKPAAQAKGKK